MLRQTKMMNALTAWLITVVPGAWRFQLKICLLAIRFSPQELEYAFDLEGGAPATAAVATALCRRVFVS
jgi:hypothetical protein